MNDKNKEFTYTVGAVYEDLPENSSFRIDILTHFDNFLLMWDIKDADWKLWAEAFFISVPDKAIPSVSESLKNYLPVHNKAREDFKINRFNLIPLKDVGESSRKIWSSGLFPSLHPAALLAPSIMAVFILLIACFNFANTSIATFSRRLKEIGLRKTFGGQRHQLVTQFMLETLIVCLFALFLGIVTGGVSRTCIQQSLVVHVDQTDLYRLSLFLDISFVIVAADRISCRCLPCCLCELIQSHKCS